jgi:hypothetical protein
MRRDPVVESAQRLQQRAVELRLLAAGAIAAAEVAERAANSVLARRNIEQTEVQSGGERP